jgi:hypothetical protein
MIRQNINAENIRDNLRKFAAEPHLAGTDANNRLADMIAKQWTNSGIEGDR